MAVCGEILKCSSLAELVLTEWQEVNTVSLWMSGMCGQHLGMPLHHPVAALARWNGGVRKRVRKKERTKNEGAEV